MHAGTGCGKTTFDLAGCVTRMVCKTRFNHSQKPLGEWPVLVYRVAPPKEGWLAFCTV